MRKLITALLLVVLLASPSHALTDAYWKPAWTTAWTAMKNASHWYYTNTLGYANGTPAMIWEWKWAAHKFTPTRALALGFYNSITQNVAGGLNFCGHIPYSATINSSTEYITDNYKNWGHDNDPAENDAIKFTATTLPTGLSGSTTYYVKNKTITRASAVAISSIDLRGDFNIKITTATSHGLTSGDEVYLSGIGGTTQLNGNRYVVDVDDATSFTLRRQAWKWSDGVTYGGYTSGGTVQKQTCTFQISTTQGGTAFDFSDSGTAVSWYPAARPLHYDGTCSYSVANEYRGNIESFIKAYIYFKALEGDPNGLTTDELNMVYEIIDGQIDNYIYQDAVTINFYYGDNDQTIITYFNSALWAAVNHWLGNTAREAELLNFNNTIGETSEQRNGGRVRGVGGLDYTTAGSGSLRAFVHESVQTWAGGEIPTGGEYGGEVAIWIHLADVINNIYGTNHFPDISAVTDNIIEAWTHEATPDLAYKFLWGDAQEERPAYNASVLKSAAEWSSNSTLKSRASYLFNRRWTTKYEALSRIDPYGYFDPYGSPSALDLTGNTSYNSAYSGHAFYHTGWTSADSAYFSMFLRNQFGDHHPTYFSNLEWYRHGGWALTHVRAYLDGAEEMNANTLALWGGAGCFGGTCESARQIAYEADTTNRWVYHAGVMGGDIAPTECSFSPLSPQPLREWTESRFFLKNADASETIVQFDRLFTTNPQNSANYSQWAANFGIGTHMSRLDWKHTFLWHIPTAGGLSVNNHVYSWTAHNGDAMKLYAFMGGNETYGTVEDAEVNSGFAFKRLEISEASGADGFRGFVNVLHTGSTPTVTEITASSGETAHGVLIVTGSEKKAILFNGTANTPLADPALVDCGYGFPTGYRWDANKHIALRNQSYFKTGTTFTIPTTAATEVHIVDLDPARTWTANIDGAGAASITPSAQGVYSVNISASGSNHTIVLASTSQCNGTDWRACSCGSPDTCTAAGWFCFNNTCNSAAQCDPTHRTGCTVLNCATDGAGYWWGSPATCQATPAPSCDINHCSLCSAGACSGAGCVLWEDNTCHSTAAPTCDDDCDLCSTTDGGIECLNSQKPCYRWTSGTCSAYPQPSYEDLTSWVVNDTGGYQTVTTQQTTTIGTHMPGNAISLLHKDSGQGYWTNFSQQFDVRTSSYDGYGVVNLVPWSISNNAAATYSGLSSGHDGIGLIFDVWNNRYILRNFITGESDQDNGTAMIWNNWRYFVAEGDGTNVTVKIYSSAARDAGSLLDTLQVAYDGDAFRYTTVNASDGSGYSGNYEISAVANVDLGQAQGPVDPPTTTNALSVFGSCSIGSMN